MRRVFGDPLWFLITTHSGATIWIYGQSYDVGTMNHGEFATREDPEKLCYRFYNSENTLIGYVPFNRTHSIGFH